MEEIKVDNLIYNVNSLSKIHPGGELFVKLFAGRDATNVFLSYHRRIFPHERMREHLIKSLPEQKNQEKDYLELCGLIEQVLPRNRSYAPLSYYIKVVVLLASAVGLETYIHIYNQYCWYLTGTLGLIMALIGLNIQHDANHGAISNIFLVNRILGMSQNWIGGSAIDWMHQHVVQHHLHTNHVIHDPDIQGSTLLRFNPIKTILPHHALQHIYFFFLIGLMGMDIVFESLYNNIKGYHHTVMSSWLTYNRVFETTTTILFGVRWVIIPLLQQNTWEMRTMVMAQIVPMYVVAGYYLAFFFIISHNFVGVAHFLKNEQMKSFLFQQVTSSSNVGGPWLCFLNGGLNYQIEHHLFPRIHHSHYPKIAPIVREFCLARNIPYKHFTTIYDNLCSFIEYIYDLGHDIIDNK